MKNLKILFLLLLVSQTIFSQKNKIFVEYTLDNGHFENIETLIANNKEAIKITGSLNFKNEATTESTVEDNYIINQKLIKIGKKSIFSNLQDDYVYIIMPFSDNKTYFVKDDSLILNWKLIPNETLTISGYECRKASLNFRGRDYIAYYTTEIPISFGPWKFKNLPGLILYIYSETGTMNYSWKAKKIIYPYADFKNSLEWNTKEEIISLKEYVTIRENETKKKSKVIDSRSPQGSKLVKTEIKRLGLELIYEWEVETKEN